MIPADQLEVLRNACRDFVATLGSSGGAIPIAALDAMAIVASFTMFAPRAELPIIRFFSEGIFVAVAPQDELVTWLRAHEGAEVANAIGSARKGWARMVVLLTDGHIDTASLELRPLLEFARSVIPLSPGGTA